jgi:hypothetical protein
MNTKRILTPNPTSPTSVYGRSASNRRWTLIHSGTWIECQTIGDNWRMDSFDADSACIHETLTIPDTGSNPSSLPREYQGVR